MDRCPAETWSHIFSYACRDGGSTGCSLSLTSKYIHETSKSVRYQSVAICGIAKVHCFYHLFKRGETSPIIYLFISDGDPPRRDGTNTMRTLHLDTTATMISNILHSNAASLSSLTIVSSCFSLQLLPPISFPSIADLSLVSSGRSDRTSPTPVLPESLPIFPRLRRLQLANIDNGDILGRPFSVSPSVSHLHVTGHRLAPSLDKLPPTVQSISLQPASHVMDIDPEPYLQWLRHVIELMEDTSIWTRITLLKAPAFRAPHNSCDARIAWEHTKEGENTWWTSRDGASVGGLLAQLQQAAAGERFLP